jgi:hypothetical protein
MNIRTTVRFVLGILAIGLTGYGVGSGWVRFGPPGRGLPAASLPGLERTPDESDIPRREFRRIPPLDDQVIQVWQGTTSSTAGSASTSTTPATTIVEIREAFAGNANSPSQSPAYVTRTLGTPVLLRATTFNAKLDQSDSTAKIAVSGLLTQQTQVSGTQDKTDGHQYDFNLTGKVSGQATLALTPPSGGQPSNGKTSVQLVVPSANGLVPPTISAAGNSQWSDASPVATGSTLAVYGTYLKLSGADAPPGNASLDFFVYAFDGTDYVFQGPVENPIITIDAGTRNWSATLSLPAALPLSMPVHVFAVAHTNDNQQFSTSPLVVQRAPFAFGAGDRPAITGVSLTAGGPVVQPKTDVTDPTSAARILVNSRNVFFSGTGAKAQTRVLIYIDGTADPVAWVDASASNWATSVASKTLDDSAALTARAVMVQGNQQSQRSDPFQFLVSSTGPSIDAVAVSNPGPSLGVTELTVRFKGNALDPSTANTAANFLLQPSNPTTTAQKPASAQFDAATNTVVLRFNALPADQYTLQLAPAGGLALLKDLYGNSLSGSTSYAVANTPDGGEIVDGIPKPEKAHNPVFPEFNNPRPETNGFNPSDHVDTRVSRLYYYRDARRVAEIINRDLKSYNQAAVDTRRRLAEKARTSADTLTDQRRLQEIKAVRAAQASREAQRRLDQAQAALQQSQNTVNIAAQNLPVLQQQQAQLQQQLNAQTAADAASTPPAPGTTAAGTPSSTTPARPSPAAIALNAQLANVTAQINQLQSLSGQPNSQFGTQTAAVQAAQADLQAARAQEAQSSDQTVQDQAAEDRARENQFRLEVAAAQEDPNSYVPGDPKSIDPVLQVSISVIGEGVIQLRGPIKGINIIRRMIDEIDAPVGQVRIALHTVQINGEHEDRMEKVASRIQAYVDHARFLTVQSGQMLRNSVVRVASRKAQQACAEIPADKASDPKYADSQAMRDRKYQEAFFGVDFINELHEIDAEFLHTSNKLLSLHSMDSTSLASALFMLALAKNETRLEILEDFKERLAVDLPEAEMNFELSSGRTGKEHHHQVHPLAQNARFQSLMGFFNAEVDGNDTLNPLQREFIKLAQIFKSRLVTELEYNQRFKERGLIEDRLGNYQEELKKQKDREAKAERLKDENRKVVNRQRERVRERLTLVRMIMRDETRQVDGFKKNIVLTKQVMDRFLTEKNHQLLVDQVLKDAANAIPNKGLLPLPRKVPFPIGTDPSKAEEYLVRISPAPNARTFQETLDEVERLELNKKYLLELTNAKLTDLINDQEKSFIITQGKDGQIAIDPSDPTTTTEDLAALTDKFYKWITQDSDLKALASQFTLSENERIMSTFGAAKLAHLLTDMTSTNPQTKAVTNNPISVHIIFEYAEMLAYYNEVFDEVDRRLEHWNASSEDLIASMNMDQQSPLPARQKWASLKDQVQRRLRNTYWSNVRPRVTEIDNAFEDLVDSYASYRSAEREALDSRRALDAKKLLDSLMDEIEDKYVELLEGIRSHTANIDGYVKSIATALDDDLNTQFYYPAFQEIRKSSSYYDVELGQVETTNILTNNRMFAKVEPQATMEFDLPKRDILINEAMNGAKAIMDTYGALVTDPSFLALTKLQSGQPTSSPAQGFGSGGNTVRNVLPGLPRSNDEQLLSQAPAGRREFGSPLEALIPDPAIYKFETGTGFEIRPVIQPDGQSVVFHLDYMYTTNVREPVRADEKHLGRIKRHFIDTEVQLGNYELREVSRYTVALKASRTGRGVPLLEDVPGLGILFRPLPSASSSLQQNVILAQSTIFPTLFELIGLRIAPVVADLDTLRLRNSEFVVRGRAKDVTNRVFDYSTSRVDEFLRVPPAERRPDLYRSQETIPDVHPNGYQGGGLNQRDSELQEGYDPVRANPSGRYVPSESSETPMPSALPGTSSSSLYVPRRVGLDPGVAASSYSGSASVSATFATASPRSNIPPPRSLPPLPRANPAARPRPTAVRAPAASASGLAPLPDTAPRPTQPASPTPRPAMPKPMPVEVSASRIRTNAAAAQAAATATVPTRVANRPPGDQALTRASALMTTSPRQPAAATTAKPRQPAAATTAKPRQPATAAPVSPGTSTSKPNPSQSAKPVRKGVISRFFNADKRVDADQ